ncbi:uncharacterized protein K444DRAFT_415368 [Hyaloscypha bicolor E]|uniref:Uncharacterized protein n=1 Tax=Hyaloscypha bicolor E TaxID=1095630 RepID=A0A2J6T6R8_9HELO|nr:uncharacterized protein K444DRAFT_415368 [Hyaloscypha bicolor E]PMD58715.1 hypothetical protein K444DRAFT_415368 [Hyaloscypha bicolor E]
MFKLYPVLPWCFLIGALLGLAWVLAEKAAPHTRRYIQARISFCFKALWRPGVRGAIGDLNLIRWIDDNACFEIGAWILQGSSILLHPRKRRVSDSLSQCSEVSIGALHRVLRSGMRLVCLDFDKHYTIPIGS